MDLTWLNQWANITGIFSGPTPCPFCGLGGGFHDREIHANVPSSRVVVHLPADRCSPQMLAKLNIKLHHDETP